MKRLLTTGVVALLVYFAGSSHVFAAAKVNQTEGNWNLGNKPLVFTQNLGQWDDHVLYRADAGGTIIWFTRDGLLYQFTRRIESTSNARYHFGTDTVGLGMKTAEISTSENSPDQNVLRADGFHNGADSTESMLIKATFAGCNANTEIFADGPLDYKCNFFHGNDPDKWRTNVPSFSAITFNELYPGIDLRFYGDDGGQMTYEFRAALNADITKLMVEYERADEVTSQRNGRKVLLTPWGEIDAAFNVRQGDVGMISAKLLSNEEKDNTIGRQLESVNQIGSSVLQLYFSTYLGGTYSDVGNGIAVDEAGFVYVTGYTISTNFPTMNSYDATDNPDNDVFLTKYSPSGAMIYSTYLGGDGPDEGYAITVTESNYGRIYLTGSTSSTDFPLQNPFQTYQGSVDVFVTCLSKIGDALWYSTYLGGSGSEYGYGIAVVAGSAFITGQVYSANFPIKNPFQTYQGGIDAFVTELSPLCDSLIYSTYLGGSDHDYAYGIAVDMFDYAYITGQTISSDFPLENPFQTYQGPASYADAFVTKLHSSGSSLVYSTYLGGGHIDRGRAIVLADYGSVIVTGETISDNFPVKNSYQTDQGVADAFVTKFGRDGDSLIYSTYLGGSGSDYGYGIAVGPGAIAYVTGSTSSSDFPSSNQLQEFDAAQDAFVTALYSSGDSLIFSTCLGGDLYDYGYGIAINDQGNVYVTGSTQSTNFPIQNAYQDTYQGGASGALGGDAFVTKLYFGLGNLSFRPNPDGWGFANAGGNMWPQSWWQQFDYSKPWYPLPWRWLCSPSDFPDWHLWVRTFGEDQCYFRFGPNQTYKPSATSKWLDTKSTWAGSCVGFATSSLLFFDGILDVPTEFPGYNKLFDVPIGDDSRVMVNMYWNYIHGEAQRDYVNANWSVTTPTQTLNACVEMFQSAGHDNRTLYMANNNGNGGHVVVPYLCVAAPTDPDVKYIYIYDNNSPGNENLNVAINTATDTWSYAQKPTWGGAKRLFLLEPSSSYVATPILSGSSAKGNKPTGAASRALTQYAEFYLPATGNAVFHSAADSIGYDDGTPFSNLVDGMPIVLPTGEETPPIGYYLPNHPWSIELSGFTDTTLRVSTYLDSTVLAYTRYDVSSLQTERLEYAGNDSSIMVINSDAVSHLYNFQVISIHPDSEIVVGIGHLTSEANDSDRLSITGESGLKIDNYGASSIYSVSVEMAGPLGDSTFFHDSVSIGDNSSHIIMPDWRQNNDTLIVLIDAGIDGGIDDTIFLSNDILTDVTEQGDDGVRPYLFELVQNYPNPFNPVTTIEYSIATRSHVTIDIFNVLGQKVRTLVNETKSAGSYRIEWNGEDNAGSSVSTGMYLYRFQAGDVFQTKKMLLIK